MNSERCKLAVPRPRTTKRHGVEEGSFVTSSKEADVKAFVATAAAIDRVVRDASLRARIVDGQRKALEHFSRENVSRILLEHVDKVSRR